MLCVSSAVPVCLSSEAMNGGREGFDLRDACIAAPRLSKGAVPEQGLALTKAADGPRVNGRLSCRLLVDVLFLFRRF